MDTSKKLVILAVLFVFLSPFFTHVWDMNTLTTSLYLFENNDNIYHYYANITKNLQQASGLPVYYEGFTYTITEIFIFYPFYHIYQAIFHDPLPISIGGQILHLLTVNFSPNFMLYNMIMKIPLMILFLIAFYVVEKQQKSNFANFLLYPLFITAVLGMAEIMIALFIFIFVLAFIRKNYLISGLALGLASFKIYPLIILPYVLVVLLKEHKFKGILLFLVGLLVVNIPSILYVLQDVDSFRIAVVDFQANRLAGGITPINVIWSIPNFYFNFYVSKIYGIISVVSYLAVLIFVLAKPVRFEEGVLLMLLIFMLSSKLVNEQFLLSAFPLLALSDKRLAMILGILVLAFALVRINPIYFSSPSLYSILPDYQSFIKSYYNFVTAYNAEFLIWMVTYSLAVIFSIKLFTTFLAYHKILTRRNAESFEK